MSPHRHLACRGTNLDAMLKFIGLRPPCYRVSCPATTTEARTKQDKSIGFRLAFAGTKKQISNLVDAIEGRGGNPQIYERLDDRESELKQLTVQLEGLNEKLTGHLEFLNAPDRIVSCALDLRTYIESEDPEVARMFILSFVKRVEVLGTEAIIHYKMPPPQDVTGGTKTTDTVKIAKNGDRQESWLSPTPAGIDRAASRAITGRCRFPRPRGDRPAVIADAVDAYLQVGLLPQPTGLEGD